MTDNVHEGGFAGYIPNQPTTEWEWRESALRMTRQTLEKFDSDRDRYGQPRLADMPLSREEMAAAIKAVLTGPQDVSTFLCAAARCVAAVEAVMKAEDADPYLGGDAA